MYIYIYIYIWGRQKGGSMNQARARSTETLQKKTKK